MIARILHLLAPVALLLAVSSPASADDRHQLRFINASEQEVDVFWLQADDQRIERGVILPHGDMIINTSADHRFVLVGREDQHTETVTSKVRFQGFYFDPEASDGIPAFYSQVARVHGFPIVASERVNPYALKEAVFIVESMIGHRPEILEAMAQSGARLCIMAHDEFTTDLPEFAWLGRRSVRDFEEFNAKDYWDSRARGLGGSATDPFCSCAEENLLGFPGDPYSKENILIHEFAHNIHLRGVNNIDPTFDDRLRATYEKAMAAGRWKGKYASVNHHEYFAEGAQSWFDDNRVNDHDHNHVNTRALLIEYDPDLAELCREVFGDNNFSYTRAEKRLHGHLEGYDPDTAPTFSWPERVEVVRQAIRAKAVARDEAANAAVE